MLWFRKKGEAGADGSGAARGARRQDPLVRALLETFDPATADALFDRGWEPATAEESVAYAIAAGAHRDLAQFGDAAVEPIERSSAVHRWSSEVLLSLSRIASPAAIDCLRKGMCARLRSGAWDATCTELLRGPGGPEALVSELRMRFEPQTARLLASVGWRPETVGDEVAVCIANRDYTGAAAFGDAAEGPLIRALGVLGDTYDILTALAAVGTVGACRAVIGYVRQQWRLGRSRWTDIDLIVRCGSHAVRVLLATIASDPTQASLCLEALTRLVDAPDALTTADLQAVAGMSDATHVHYVPEDPRPYTGTLDCSDLRQRASRALAERGD